MNDIYYITLLYDFYGELLSEKQKLYFEGKYLNDLSLNEIAFDNGVTKQAVHAALKSAEELLSGYEKSLGLVSRYLTIKEQTGSISAKLEALHIKELEPIIEELKNISV